MTKILAFAGSTRRDSFNDRLVRVAAAAARSVGAEVTHVSLRDDPMPLYDGDLESAEGMPDSARRFRQLLVEHDGFLMACPEYNSSVTGVWKNAIDWASRPVDGEGVAAVFGGKVAALTAASPGALGGLRGLVHVRAILGNLGVHVLPGQLAVPKAHEAFDDDGNLKDERTAGKLDGIVRELVDVTRRLRG